MWAQSIALLVILLAVLPLSCLSSTPGHQFAGYELLQFHKDRGEVVLDVCPYGIKATTKKSNLITICTPPYAKVVCYSPRTHTIFSIDLQHFTGEDRVVFAATGNPQFDTIPIKQAGVGTIRGLPVEEFESPHSFAESQMAAWHQRAATGSFPSQVHYSVSSKLTMQPQFGLFMSRFYRFPETKSVAVELLYDSLEYKKVTELTTLSCHPKTFTSDDFKQPTDYKKVKTLAEVQADMTDQKEAETLINSFDTKPVDRR
jgi:hypothetical protein